MDRIFEATPFNARGASNQTLQSQPNLKMAKRLVQKVHLAKFRSSCVVPSEHTKYLGDGHALSSVYNLDSDIVSLSANVVSPLLIVIFYAPDFRNRI